MKLGDAVDKVLNDVSERVLLGGVNVIGISTGFPALDNATGGYRKRGLYIIGGKTGLGKSSLALSQAMAQADEGHSIYYSSLEMSAELLALRYLSGATGIDSSIIERGLLTPEQFKLVKEQRERVNSLSIHINDSRMTSEELAVDMARFKDKHPLDCAYVDYISLLSDKGPSEVQKLEEITANLSRMASELDIPLVGLVQLNRGTDDQQDHVPTLTNIRYSDRMSHDAFVVMFVHRPHLYAMRESKATAVDREDALIIIDKNRQGPMGHINVSFYPKQMRWAPREVVEPPPTNVKGLKK